MSVFDFNEEQQRIALKIGNEINSQLIEELAELTQALCKLKRAEGNGQPVDFGLSYALEEVENEIVDVLICIQEYIWLNNTDMDKLEYIKGYKIDRTLKRLQGLKQDRGKGYE